MPTDHGTKFGIANLTERDEQFLHGIKALFTDPKYEALLEEVRAGKASLLYNPNGQLAATFSPEPAAPAELIAFVGRFSDEQWARLEADERFNTKQVLENGVEAAERRATQILGALPPARLVEMGQG